MDKVYNVFIKYIIKGLNNMWFIFLFLIFMIFIFILIMDKIFNLAVAIIMYILGLIKIEKEKKIFIEQNKIANKNKYAEKQRFKEELIKKEKEQKNKNNFLKQEEEYMNAILLLVNELRIKYPFADQKLIEKYKLNLRYMSQNEREQLELQIKQSHFDLLKQKDEFVFNKIYTVADLDNLVALSEDKELPIIIRLYKPDNFNYLIYAVNIDTEEMRLYRFKNYENANKFKVDLLDMQNKLKLCKQNIVSQDMDSLYNFTLDEFNKTKEI